MSDKEREEFLNREGYYSERQVAALMDIKQSTLRNRISIGKDHPPRSPDGNFSISEYHKWNKTQARYQLNKVS